MAKPVPQLSCSVAPDFPEHRWRCWSPMSPGLAERLLAEPACGCRAPGPCRRSMACWRPARGVGRSAGPDRLRRARPVPRAGEGSFRSALTPFRRPAVHTPRVFDRPDPRVALAYPLHAPNCLLPAPMLDRTAPTSVPPAQAAAPIRAIHPFPGQLVCCWTCSAPVNSSHQRLPVAPWAPSLLARARLASQWMPVQLATTEFHLHSLSPRSWRTVVTMVLSALLAERHSQLLWSVLVMQARQARRSSMSSLPKWRLLAATWCRQRWYLGARMVCRTSLSCATWRPCSASAWRPFHES